jgi:hypothetical protein
MRVPERVDRIAEPWGRRTPYAADAPWPVRVDTFIAAGVDEGDVDKSAMEALRRRLTE